MKNTTNTKYEVTVIIVTRRRWELLNRAIKSILNQTYIKNIKISVLVDDCIDTRRFLERNYSNNTKVKWELYIRNELDRSGPELLARLRTKAIRNIDTDWFSFLDDDNEYYPEHIEKLVSFACQEKVFAVHSYREILYRDGEPFLKMEWPWSRYKEDATNKYLEMESLGVVEKNSNVYKDKYGVIIDTNIWLLHKKLFELDDISDHFSNEDWEENLAEDDKLMYLLMANGIIVKCNSEVTVKYYLGGYSNVFDGSVSGTIKWNNKNNESDKK